MGNKFTVQPKLSLLFCPWNKTLRARVDAQASSSQYTTPPDLLSRWLEPHKAPSAVQPGASSFSLAHAGVL